MGGVSIVGRRPFHLETIMTKKYADYPALKWHPETGVSTLFHTPESVPAGYLDVHPKNLSDEDRQAAIDAASGKVALPLTRAEIMEELTEAGVKFKPKATTDQLYELLVSELTNHLTEIGVEFPADADAKALLALVPKPE
jgi:hypothetical protein